MNNKYLELYLSFLKTEVPHIFQIMTLPSIFILAIPIHYINLLLIVLMALLLYLFLEEKLKSFLIEQVKNQFSSLNINKLHEEELTERWKAYAFLTVILLSALVGLLSYSFKTSA